jgi:hypothetical protein
MHSSPPQPGQRRNLSLSHNPCSPLWKLTLWRPRPLADHPPPLALPKIPAVRGAVVAAEVADEEARANAP